MNRYNAHIYNMFKADNTERMNRYNALNHFAIVLQKNCKTYAVIVQTK